MTWGQSSANINKGKGKLGKDGKKVQIPPILGKNDVKSAKSGPFGKKDAKDDKSSKKLSKSEFSKLSKEE